MKIQNIATVSFAAAAARFSPAQAAPTRAMDAVAHGRGKASAVASVSSSTTTPLATPVVRHLTGTTNLTGLIPPCPLPNKTQEIVNFNYTYNLVYVEDEVNGLYMYHQREAEHGVGLGETSGKRYWFVDGSAIDDSFTSTAPSTETIHEREVKVVIEQGSGVVYDFFADIEFTYNPDNGTQYLINSWKSQCPESYYDASK